MPSLLVEEVSEYYNKTEESGGLQESYLSPALTDNYKNGFLCLSPPLVKEACEKATEAGAHP
ncbi:hypothetical protein PHLCEN_2v7492 [Hermanssonia centrifuga]|uniref:Uncharacterized protein n=1 Tax=Hermanssonia centrifuga TaxID=98765 RepID=A0A2R6NWG3_9APHY|nr:hypothetical protein PHLCEN_2v7492 [Hermanssonia centrifuga]